MNSDILEGQWKQLKGTIKDKWGKLTDDDLDRIEGNYDKSATDGKRMRRSGSWILGSPLRDRLRQSEFSRRK